MDGTLCWGDLSDRIGWAPQTSLRLAVSNLCDIGILAKVTQPGAPRRSATELTEAGRDLLTVADCLELWLQRAPNGPIPLDSAAAIGAVRALTAGWDSIIVRELAERSMTLTELDGRIDDVSYPTLERRLARLRATNLVTRLQGSGKGKPYVVSEWLRHAIAPLSVAGRWERAHMAGEAEEISHVEVEAAFLLTLPLVSLPSDIFGDCALVVLTSAGEEKSVSGVTIALRRGAIVSCSSAASSNPTTWALGTPDEWFDAVIDGDFKSLRIQGVNPTLPLRIVQGIHSSLFPASVAGSAVGALAGQPR